MKFKYVSTVYNSRSDTEEQLVDILSISLSDSFNAKAMP